MGAERTGSTSVLTDPHQISSLNGTRTRRTLLILVGLAIALVLAAHLISRAVIANQIAARSTAASNAVAPMGAVPHAVNLFTAHVGRRPWNLSELIQMLNKHPDRARWFGPYLKDAEYLIDPWGRAYLYDAEGTRSMMNFELWSAGPNGIDESSDGDEDYGDDIRNWK